MMDKKEKIKAGLIFGIIMFTFFFLKDLLTTDHLTTKIIIINIVSGLIGASLGGFGFGWLMGLLANSKLITQGTKIDLGANETKVFETRASHFKGFEGVGGKLYLTNKRLVFMSHKFNIQNHELSINLSDIDKVDRYKVFGIANTGLKVATTEKTIEKFGVEQPDEWHSQLKEKNKVLK